MTKNNFKLNYIKCPNCKNILDLTFVARGCPNPLCQFSFKGLEALLVKNNSELHKAILSAYKGNDERKIKLLATAVRNYIAVYLANFIQYAWGSQMQRLFKNFIILYLDDLNALQIVLKSKVIKPDKDNTVISKNNYKIFPELYNYLMRVHSTEIRNFLRLEFPKLYRDWYKKMHERSIKPIISNQSRLV